MKARSITLAIRLVLNALDSRGMTAQAARPDGGSNGHRPNSLVVEVSGPRS